MALGVDSCQRWKNECTTSHSGLLKMQVGLRELVGTGEKKFIS